MANAKKENYTHRDFGALRPQGLASSSKRFEVIRQKGALVKHPAPRDRMTEVYVGGQEHCRVLALLPGTSDDVNSTFHIEHTTNGRGDGYTDMGAVVDDQHIFIAGDSKYDLYTRRLEFERLGKQAEKNLAEVGFQMAKHYVLNDTLPITQDSCTYVFVSRDRSWPRRPALRFLKTLDLDIGLGVQLHQVETLAKYCEVFQIAHLICVNNTVFKSKEAEMPYWKFGQFKQMLLLRVGG